MGCPGGLWADFLNKMVMLTRPLIFASELGNLYLKADK